MQQHFFLGKKESGKRQLTRAGCVALFYLEEREEKGRKEKIHTPHSAWGRKKIERK